MNEEQMAAQSITELIKQPWFWSISATGGVVDFISQGRKGNFSMAKCTTLALAGVVHTFTAMFFGAITAFGVGAIGYTSEMALGCACGAGGFLGIRIIGVLTTFLKGQEVKK